MKNPNFHAEKIFVAFSGGCDSTALLIWAKAHFKEVVALHFNHGWPASQAIEKHAMAVAQQLEISPQVGAASTY